MLFYSYFRTLVGKTVRRGGRLAAPPTWHSRPLAHRSLWS